MAAPPPVDIKKLIREFEEAVKAAREELDKAIRAGVDVAEQEKIVSDLEASLARFKAVYV